MDKDTALDLALEALEEAHYKVEHKQDAAKREKAITAIKQARSAPVQKRPQNCGTGYCSCVECVMEPAPVQEPWPENLAAPVQEWRLVPVLATREIEDAIGKARNLKASEIWEDALAAAPQPAQQQEPCGWQFFQDGKWHNGMEINDHRANTEAAGIPVRDVYPSPPAQPSKPWVRLTDDDKCVKELYESDTDPEWIDGYTAGLKDAENKLRRYNAQPALVVEQLNPVAEVKLKQQGGNAGFATVINEIYDPMREPLRVGDKLYTSPPAQRKPLTHEQRVDLLAKFEAHKHEWHAPAILIDMVEAAHGIKEKNI